MRYTSVVAILDDVPDLIGEIIKNAAIPGHIVPVSMDFKNIIGIATLERVDNKIIAVFEINENLAPPRLIEMFTGVLGGHIGYRADNVIEQCFIKEIGLTRYPADTRLSKLKVINE